MDHKLTDKEGIKLQVIFSLSMIIHICGFLLEYSLLNAIDKSEYLLINQKILLLGSCKKMAKCGKMLQSISVMRLPLSVSNRQKILGFQPLKTRKYSALMKFSSLALSLRSLSNR